MHISKQNHVNNREHYARDNPYTSQNNNKITSNINTQIWKVKRWYKKSQ